MEEVITKKKRVQKKTTHTQHIHTHTHKHTHKEMSTIIPETIVWVYWGLHLMILFGCSIQSAIILKQHYQSLQTKNNDNNNNNNDNNAQKNENKNDNDNDKNDKKDEKSFFKKWLDSVMLKHTQKNKKKSNN